MFLNGGEARDGEREGDRLESESRSGQENNQGRGGLRRASDESPETGRIGREHENAPAYADNATNYAVRKQIADNIRLRCFALHNS